MHTAKPVAFLVLSLAIHAFASAQTPEAPLTEIPPAEVPVLPEPVLEEPVAAVEGTEPGDDEVELVGYDKGFFIRTADDLFELKVRAEAQVRFTYEGREGESDLSAFSIPRLRIDLGGHALSSALRYLVKVDFGAGNAALKDGWINYAATSWLQLRVGQWKRPFSRQQITSDTKTQFVERAITDRAFGGGRDLGIAIHNDYEKSPEFEYGFGVFNGSGDRSVITGDVMVDPTTGEGEITSASQTNVPSLWEPAFVLRVGYNYGGIDGYEEASRKGGFGFAVAANGLLELDHDNDNDSRWRAGLDYILKAGSLATSGAVYLSSVQDGPSVTSDRGHEALGFHAEVSYLIADTVLPAVRYARVDPEGSDATDEITAGLGVFIFGNELKWQTDGSVLLTGDDMDYRVRTQLAMHL